MEVRYFTTTNFIRHQGNVIDLTEYRRKLALVNAPPVEEAAAPAHAVRRRRRRAVTPALFGDYCASGAIVLMALVFTIKMATLF